ncbi:MAG TPA: hypothetical protein VEG44_04440 [Candidatus Acidoferrales bacterium]|nr:hypothetical protein [Candidatus Acidoferrales bacterium]
MAGLYIVGTTKRVRLSTTDMSGGYRFAPGADLYKSLLKAIRRVANDSVTIFT